jgi:hypothetical protein
MQPEMNQPQEGTACSLPKHWEDRMTLIQNLLNLLTAQSDESSPSPRLTREAEELLRRYTFPGGSVELEGIIRHALAQCDGEEIRPLDLPIDQMNERIRAFSRRAIVLIEQVLDSGSGREIVVSIPQWNSRELVHFPETDFPPELRPHLIANRALIARVNIDVESPEELRMTDIELTPDEDLESEPA